MQEMRFSACGWGMDCGWKEEGTMGVASREFPHLVPWVVGAHFLWSASSGDTNVLRAKMMG
jgi:hypothetical protein